VGTTTVAAKLLGRDCIGVEKLGIYYKQAKANIKDTEVKIFNA